MWAFARTTKNIYVIDLKLCTKGAIVKIWNPGVLFCCAMYMFLSLIYPSTDITWIFLQFQNIFVGDYFSVIFRNMHMIDLNMWYYQISVAIAWVGIQRDLYGILIISYYKAIQTSHATGHSQYNGSISAQNRSSSFSHYFKLPLDKMAAVLQTIFSDAFLWMRNFLFWLKFHWSLFLRVQLTIIQHWFR